MPERAAVELLVPGLAASFAQGAAPLPAALMRLFACASRSTQPEHPAEIELARRCGLPAGAAAEFPLAAVSALADDLPAQTGTWLRADLVHLRADQHRLRLYGAASLALTAAEMTELDTALRDFFAADHMEFFLAPAAPQARGYLRWSGPIALHTTPPDALEAQDIDAHLPRGADARRWLARLTEIQMLLHGHPVNAARRAQGRPEANSLWFWGAGALPPAVAQPPRLWGAGALCTGLARWAGTPAPQPADDVHQLLAAPAAHALAANHPAANPIVWLPALRLPAAHGEAQAWCRALDTLLHDWFLPLQRALARGAIGSLDVWPGGDVRYRLTRRGLWRFWRRAAPLPVASLS